MNKGLIWFGWVAIILSLSILMYSQTISKTHGRVDQFIILPSLINGKQVAFWIPSTPLYSSSVYVWRNGLLQAQGIDYNMSEPTNAIVFTPDSIPQVGDILICSYEF